MTDPTFLLALAAAVLSGVSIVLHVVAPRTKTTLDDQLRDDIDEVLAFIRGRVVAAPSQLTPPPSTPGLLALLLVALCSGAMSPACGARQAVVDTGERIVDCAKLDADKLAALAGELARAVAVYAIAGVPVDWDAIEARAESAGLSIGGCALGPLVASRAPDKSRAMAAPPANDAARAWAAFARLKTAAGVTAFRTSAGDL